MATIDPFDFFKSSKRSEVAELELELNHNKLEKRMEALKKVIAMMTVGKDVSSLFFPVLKCVETNNVDLKKLVYLYIINYAKTQPDLAVLAVNTFRKDARERLNPLIRGLAVRTMGCIGVDTILDYLCEPLKESMGDEDPYVRKTAAVCVAKLFEINQQRVEDYKFIEKLEEMLGDGNGMVVSNAVAALTDIQHTKGKIVQMTQTILYKLLNALPECSEWGRIYILDFLADNMLPSAAIKSGGIEEIIQRIVPNLAHSNSAVVLSATKVILKYLDYMTGDTEMVRSVCRKMAPPLISLMNSEPEIQYIAIRNINLIIQKRPYIIDKEVRVFFCNFQDPLYVKLEKLEILIRLADLKNVDSLLNELKDYAQEVDVLFVRRSISAIGRIAIKLDRAADRCIQVLHQLINTKIDYVVQEAIIVIKDIFRKYPNRYESIIKDLCENLKALDNVDARASMIWIVGEYGDRIDNAVDLLTNFSQSFKDEARKVQHALLNATVKLFLKVEGNGGAEELVQDVLRMATEESDNPDLRNRGYIYWKMLSSNPEMAKQIILCEKPTISEDASTLEPQILDKLVGNISMLSSVYYKVPDTFVKKIRDRINERLDLENEEVQVISQQSKQAQAEYVDSTGVKKSEYIKESQVAQATYMVDLLSLDDQPPMKQGGAGTNAIDDLLGIIDTTPPVQHSTQPVQQQHPMQINGGGSDLLDLIDTTAHVQQPSIQAVQSSALDDLLGGMGQESHTETLLQKAQFVKVPYQVVLNGQTAGQKGQQGLQIEAAFQRDGNGALVLDMKLTNLSTVPISDCLMKLNQNHFGLALHDPFPTPFTLRPQESRSLTLTCHQNRAPGGPPPLRPPVLIQAGINCSLDLFYFTLPALLQVLLSPTQLEYQMCSRIWSSFPVMQECKMTMPSMSAQITNGHALITRLQENRIYYLNQATNEQGSEVLYVYCSPEEGDQGVNQHEIVVAEIGITPTGGVEIQATSQSGYMSLLFLQAVKFVLSANT
ncbi:hypothetical protein FGO68_gene17379 [Halteria grandinella]|uniref:AP complex subunit beta n=1 Tax=Halteria grandinella TaxID=5974 RepID=A0A8J8P1Z3_HALGN|nr:hypothetical protein FGO68_gene17379 [Halteria grandinella]